MGKELFDNIPSKVADLLSDVKNGRIGLPDLQRPFVWKDNKVRELLDSMMKGYPIGYIMLWASPDDYENTGYITLPYYKNYLTPNEQLKLYKNICKLYLDENKTEQEVMTLLNINPTCLKYIKKLYVNIEKSLKILLPIEKRSANITI